MVRFSLAAPGGASGFSPTFFQESWTSFFRFHTNLNFIWTSSQSPMNFLPVPYELPPSPPSSQPHYSLCNWEKDDDVSEIGKWNQIGILAHRCKLPPGSNAVHPTHHHILVHRPVHENATDQPHTGIAQGDPETPASLTPARRKVEREMSDKTRNRWQIHTFGFSSIKIEILSYTPTNHKPHINN